MIEKVCEECKNLFVDYKKTMKFCSRACAGKNKTAKLTIEKACEECGCTFKAKHCAIVHGNGRFCSRKCVGAFKKRNRKQLTCPTCNKEFSVKPHMHNRIYCSRKCSERPFIRKTCKECLKSFNTKRPEAQFCSRSCHGKDIGRLPKMHQRKDLTGQTLGSYFVNGSLGMERRFGHTISVWDCTCKCGRNSKKTTGELLSKVGNKQCRVCSREDKLSIIKRQYSSSKHGSRARCLEHTISIDYAYSVLEKQEFKCAITGIKLFFRKNTGVQCDGRVSTIASIDRIDSSLGYVAGNIQWVTAHVNIAKSNFSQEEFDEMCRARVKFLDSGK